MKTITLTDDQLKLLQEIVAAAMEGDRLVEWALDAAGDIVDAEHNDNEDAASELLDSMLAIVLNPTE